MFVRSESNFSDYTGGYFYFLLLSSFLDYQQRDARARRQSKNDSDPTAAKHEEQVSNIAVHSFSSRKRLRIMEH